nr:MAG TPA: hypothetical protein [Caudoviricetes sp.]
MRTPPFGQCNRPDAIWQVLRENSPLQDSVSGIY